MGNIGHERRTIEVLPIETPAAPPAPAQPEKKPEPAREPAPAK
jgi:hypothetical protein